MSKLPWVRVSNATQDPQTRCSVAQDQIVKIVNDDGGDWYQIETIDGTAGRVPKILVLPIADPQRKPGQLIYCSTDAYTSIKSEDLSFAPYSLFVASISKKHEGYLEGYQVTDNGVQLGSVGLLPEGYLTHLPLPTDQQESTGTVGISSSFTTNFNEVDVKLRNYNVSPYARAIYDFQGEFENELSFSADEIISLRRRIDADWLEGSIGSARIGIFPASFVQIIVNLPEEDDEKVSIATASSLEKRRSTTAENDGIGFANVKHEFIGRQADELSVKHGDTVRVLKMVNDEWVMCKDPDTERTGIVPVGFLEVYLDDEDEDNPTSNKKQFATDSSFSSLNRNSFVAPTTIPEWKTSTRIETPPIQTDWNAFDSITSKSTGNHQWATFGEDWIAAEQTPKAAAPVRPPPPKQSSIQSPNDVVSVTEMFGMVERQAPPRPNAPSSMFQSANDFEIGLESATAGATNNEDKKCRILEELINSELQFITDVNSYTDAVDGSTLLSTKQKAIMRSGCAQIVQLSANLVQLLTNEQTKPVDSQQIGACFLQLRKPFAQTYGYYFRNIDHINQLLTSAKTEKTVEDALNDVVRRMRESGAGAIDGATAVARPVQRCLKYPLFLNEIVKLTPINHLDHPKLLEAVKTMSNLGQKMNESKRRKELTRKYMAEDRSTIGEKLSKMTLHSLKKKSNRFTYRMGSSLGVVKLLRDVEFDNLVCELDTAERRLVRFNYMLVIYRKKMFHETRVLLHKKVVEPRKKAISSSDADHQLYLFNEAVRSFAGVINSRVRDEIVKALRNIPKRLIKKRNDKLMDYEASKSKERGNAKRDFVEIRKDYEALNSQVKQELPKTIEYLNKVLTDAMKVVGLEDANLMAKLKMLFDDAKKQANDDPSAQSRRLIISTTPFFVAYYDPDRLKPLQRIANKAAQSMRTRARSASPAGRNGSFSKLTTAPSTSTSGANASNVTTNGSKKSSVPSVDLTSLQNQWNSETPVVAESKEHKFRPQTAEERKTILEKATAKGRLNDMFVATSHYPQDSGMLKLALTEGKLLIVRQGDLVLAVNREVPSMWLCYNGYYNAMLPSGVLRQYTKQSVESPPFEIGVDALNTITSAPQKSQNLIDLEDIFGGGSSSGTMSIQPLAPSPAPSSNTTTSFVADWNLAKNNFSPPLQYAPPPPLAPTKAQVQPTSLTFQPAQQASNEKVETPLAGANYNLDDAHLFDGLASIDWGSSSATSARTPSMPNIYANTPVETEQFRQDWSAGVFHPELLPPTAPPPLPVILNPAKEYSSFMDGFSPSTTAQNNSNGLNSTATGTTFPVMFDDASSSASSITKRSASAASKPINVWPNSTTIRSESPQPSIPSRPAPTVKNNAYPTLSAAYDVPPLQPTPITQRPNEAATQKPPLYSMVPNETISTSYAIPPMYDTTPQLTATSSGLYDVPPIVTSQQYDTPPSDSQSSVIRPVLCEVRVDYDFLPQGSNQVAVTERELVGVLQRTDDDGNPEWLLIKRSNGQVGYVPAAYCRPL